MKKNRTHGVSFLPGVSLLIALGLVTVIVLFGILVSTLVVSSIRQSANINRANEAYYAAEGGLEKGLLENQLHGAGYSSTPPAFYYQQNSLNGANVIKTVYKIDGQVPAASAYGGDSNYVGMFSVPTPGTGNGAPNCDPLKAVTNGVVSYDGVDYPTADPADHPCNWNKINVGESVTIPLYYTDASGQTVNLFTAQNAGTAKLILRVRTACGDNAVMCDKADRMKLNDLNAGDSSVGYNDAIMNWQVVGEDTVSGQPVTLGPFIFHDNSGKFTASSTIIHEKKLNTSLFKYEMLKETSKGTDKGTEDTNQCQGTFINFLTGGAAISCPPGVSWNYQLNQPVLTLSVINSLQDYNNNTIPSLEYQVLTSFPGNQTPANTAQTIRAEGFSGNFKPILEVQQQQKGGLLQYVIQQ